MNLNMQINYSQVSEHLQEGLKPLKPLKPLPPPPAALTHSEYSKRNAVL